MIDYCSKKILARQKTGMKTSKANNIKLKFYIKLALLTGAIVCAMFLGSYYAYPIVENLSSVLNLKLFDVELSGARVLKREAIINEAGITSNSNLLGLDLGEIKERISKNPFVKSAEVIRSLPHTLRINIVERKPFAILEDEGLWYLDEDGEPFKKVALKERNKLDFPILTGVPRESGEGPSYRNSVLNQSFAILRQLTKGKVLDLDKISEVNFCEIYGFSLYLGEKPLRIIIGFEDMEKKIFRLKSILSKLNNSMGVVSLIDLDYKNKAVVRLKNVI